MTEYQRVLIQNTKTRLLAVRTMLLASGMSELEVEQQLKVFF